MDLGFLTTSPVVVGVCLCVVFVIKQWVKDVDNKYIPTICAILGVCVAIWVNEWSLSPDTLLTGLVSGLASTGLHQAFTRFIDNKGDLK